MIVGLHTIQRERFRRVCRCAALWLSFGIVGGERQLSATDADAFRENGYVLTRETLDSHRIISLAERLRGLLAEHGRRAFGENENEKEVRFTFAVHEIDPEVASFLGVAANVSSLWRAASELAGAKPSELCVLMDRGFSKDPGDKETHWHRDDEAISLPAVHPLIRTVHAWIPMRAMNKDSGTLQYLVGTHKRSFSWWMNMLASLWGWEFAWWSMCPIAQDDSMKMGDVAWHDGWMLHSASANTAAVVRDGYAVSFAYCATPGACGNAVAPMSKSDPTCKVAPRLFDAEWRARHREGENDYTKTAIEEPVAIQAGRFIWRSVFGAVGGLAVHYSATSLVPRCCGRREKEE